MIIATYIYRMIRNNIVFLYEVDEFLGIKPIESNTNRCLTVLRHTKQSIHKKPVSHTKISNKSFKSYFSLWILTIFYEFIPAFLDKQNKKIDSPLIWFLWKPNCLLNNFIALYKKSWYELIEWRAIEMCIKSSKCAENLNFFFYVCVV